MNAESRLRKYDSGNDVLENRHRPVALKRSEENLMAAIDDSGTARQASRDFEWEFASQSVCSCNRTNATQCSRSGQKSENCGKKRGKIKTKTKQERAKMRQKIVREFFSQEMVLTSTVTMAGCCTDSHISCIVPISTICFSLIARTLHIASIHCFGSGARFAADRIFQTRSGSISTITHLQHHHFNCTRGRNSKK